MFHPGTSSRATIPPGPRTGRRPQAATRVAYQRTTAGTRTAPSSTARPPAVAAAAITNRSLSASAAAGSTSVRPRRIQDSRTASAAAAHPAATAVSTATTAAVRRAGSTIRGAGAPSTVIPVSTAAAMIDRPQQPSSHHDTITIGRAAAMGGYGPMYEPD